MESELGVGTTFRVYLPASAAEETPAAPPRALPAAARRGRVLVVDDEPTMIHLIRRSLSPEHDVTTTLSARVAVERITGGDRFDVILCDLMMPDMTGIDLYEALVAGAPEQAERVVFLTGGAFTADARDFLQRVPNPTMDKPFEIRKLRSVVNERVV